MTCSHFSAEAAAKRPARADRRSDGGETLIELLITIALMGLAFTSILGGMFTTAVVTNANQRRTLASNAVQSWAEGLQQPATQLENTANPRAYYTYQPCATPALYGSLGLPSGAVPSGWQATITKIELLNGFTAGGKPDFTLPLASCYALPTYFTTNEDKGLQRITIKIESPAGESPRVVDTLVIVKRDQRCPPGFDNADLGPC